MEIFDRSFEKSLPVTAAQLDFGHHFLTCIPFYSHRVLPTIRVAKVVVIAIGFGEVCEQF